LKPKVERGKAAHVGRDGDAHGRLDRLEGVKTDDIRPGDAHPVREERPEKATYIET